MDAHNEGWTRVSGHNRCPICNGDSWCTVAPDASAVRCKREQSPKPSHGEDGDAWLHVRVERVEPVRRRARPLPMLTPLRDLRPLAELHQARLDDVRLQHLAENLGVSAESLKRLGFGWSGSANSAPMFDADRNTVGIRYRALDGRKWSERGGKEGVFLPAVEPSDPLVIVEGPTDAAAALTLGFDALGRPSCHGATKTTSKLCKGRRVVVVADRDDVGRRGADALVSAIVPYVLGVSLVEPPAPHKDLRAWLRAGADRSDVEALIEGAPIRTLQVRVVTRG